MYAVPPPGKLRELLVHVLDIESQSPCLGDQLPRRIEVAPQAIDHVERQACEVASLVHQGLRFVLKLLDLVVDLLQRVCGGQYVLGQISGIDDDPLCSCDGHGADECDNNSSGSGVSSKYMGFVASHPKSELGLLLRRRVGRFTVAKKASVRRLGHSVAEFIAYSDNNASHVGCWHIGKLC